MGTIATYSDLQAAIIEWIARDQDSTLIARIPTFIQLFEAKMNRSLFVRQMEARVTALTTFDTVVTATAATSTSSNVLTFASVPSTVVAGLNVYDSTTAQQVGTVQSVSSPTVTLTTNAASAVSVNDSISFGALEPEFIALPSDFQSMRRIRVSSQAGKPLLDFLSTVQMDDYRNSTADTPGTPLYFTIFGSEIELAPTPDAAYTIEMIYRQNIPALASNSTNWLLTLSPDLYLYGSLMETAPYIKEDARLSTWGTLYSAALNDLNQLGKTSTFNAGPLTVRPNISKVW